MRRFAIIGAALALAACGPSSIEGRWIGHEFSGDPIVVAFAPDGEF